MGNYKSFSWVAWNLTLPLELVPFADSAVSTVVQLRQSFFFHLPSTPLLLDRGSNLNHKLPRNKGFAETPVGFGDVRASGAFTSPSPPLAFLPLALLPKTPIVPVLFANFSNSVYTHGRKFAVLLSKFLQLFFSRSLLNRLNCR